jgi:anti-sigma factor RsiW
MHCQELQEMMDSYLGDELLVETNHEVLHHLENCGACRGELAARRELLTRMRSAVRRAPDAQLNQEFAVNLRNNLRETALRPSAWENLKSEVFARSSVFAATSAACLLFAVMLGAVWIYHSPSVENAAVNQSNQTEKTIELSRSPESPSAQAVKIAFREMTDKAVGDHENCAVHFRLTEEPITLDEAAGKYGRFNKDLDKAVVAALEDGEVSIENNSDKTADKIKLLEAHSCIFQGRRFAHVVLRRGEKIISVLLTEAGNSSGENDAAISSQTVENLQIANFGAARYAGFVVSDLSVEENQAIARTISPAVRRHIEQAGA